MNPRTVYPYFRSFNVDPPPVARTEWQTKLFRVLDPIPIRRIGDAEDTKARKVLHTHPGPCQATSERLSRRWLAIE